MVTASKLLATQKQSGIIEPEAVDFDGVSDYLSRTNDLVGNVDGKTFTFSAWVYWDGVTEASIYDIDGPWGYIKINTDGSLWVVFQNEAGSTISYSAIAANTPAGFISKNTFQNILISVDVSLSLFQVYVNDTSKSTGFSSVSQKNLSIDFTRAPHKVGYKVNALKGRLAHVYLDYTYRDLSVEANRRLFITADRKPAKGLEALNPILYLPLNDPTQPGKNLGTGGDFALNGVVARSGRGPNQFNAPYSDLDGSEDYLSRKTTPTGIADGKRFTFHGAFNLDLMDYQTLFYFALNSTQYCVIDIVSNKVNVHMVDLSGTLLLQGSSATNLVPCRNYVLDMSFDMSDTTKRHMYINGVPSATYNTYVNSSIDFTVTDYRIGLSGYVGTFTNGRIGNVFFDTKYIDLSQPANLAKFVTGTGIDCKPVDLGANGELPFGTPPLIYLPMYANNAGRNYGTGGDFTVNSGPFVGARGPNEYWGNKADFGGITSGSYLSRGALSGVVSGKTVSLSFWVRPDTADTRYIFTINPTGGGSTVFGVEKGSKNNLQFCGYDSLSNVAFVMNTPDDSISAGTMKHVLLSFDLTSSSLRSCFINGVLSSVTWNQYNNRVIDFAAGNVVFAARNTDYAVTFDGKLSEFYFTTDYIDFSQESNRLKFRDAFGNPVDLLPQIEAGTLPNPAIYMRFDPANFGKNSGTGGDFIVNGTITDGGQL